MKEVIILVVISIVIFLFIYSSYNTKENYEPQDMGSRRFWGFGKESAYSYDDTRENQNFCYITTPDYMCMPGYKKIFNELLKREECCTSVINYGK
jgi:hypothetical protein